ncbi:hypothetical protein AGMMS50267_04040 [Spirochaetia bacterium]|nr:hypothetical protein AGMMS50267_04040 [Spirochaetia bacterium]
MIPVVLRPEPQDFDVKVRQPGLAWLAKNGINPNGPPPKAGDLPPYWQNYTEQIWNVYGGVCAYLALYFPFVLGAASTDHFIAKSQHAGKAYEWSNYRLSCLGANRKKWAYDDVLDPMKLAPDTFFLDLANGAIFPNPSLAVAQKDAAKDTIDRLELDSPNNRRWRAGHYTDYIQGHCDLDYIKRHSPFVHYEIIRQKL